MFNPSQLFRNNYVASSQIITRPSKVVLDKMTDHSRSRWDEPINIPDILYMKFRLPPPNENSSMQLNRYPLSLIDFIKRAYGQCKDQNQSRLMQNELKNILCRYEDNYNSVNWVTMPVPDLRGQKKQQQKIQVSSVVKDTILTKKQTVNLHKQHINRQSAPKGQISKTQMKVNMTLQKLQQKLNKKESAQQKPRPYIGFRQQPESYLPPKLPSNIKPGLRIVLNPPAPPLPLPSQANIIKNPGLIFPPPVQKTGNELKKSGIPNPLDDKFSRANQKPIEVVTSIVPEHMDIEKSYKYERQRIDHSKEKNDKKKEKVKITHKQLTEISRVAEKVSDLHQVAKRYQSFNKLKTQSIKNIQEYDDYDNDNGEVIIGRNKSIDKPYLRITGRPDPDTVRPEPILKKALPHFLQGYKKGSIPYDSLISQLKSIRQDLTVQHIRNAFTVQVYEQNFKISLFQNDIIQVKNCQANLWQLYRQGLYRSKELQSKYVSYHFISLILEEKYKQLQYMLTLLPEGSIEDSDIQNSLKLKQIYMLGNYRAFFDFYNHRDNVCRQLLNIYIDKVRMRCLVMFSKTCGQKISFRLLGETIGEDEDIIESLALGQGAVIRQGFFMLKQSYQNINKSDILKTKKVTNLLI